MYICASYHHSQGPKNISHSQKFLVVVVQLRPTLCNSMECSMPGFPVFHHLLLLKFVSIELVMSSNHLILCRSFLLLPPIFPSIRVFSNESALRIRQPKYWSFSFSISPSSEYSELISFRIDLISSPCCPRDSLKSLVQHHGLKASVLPCSESACNAGDLGLIPGLGRSLGEGKGYPLQYSGLANSIL